MRPGLLLDRDGVINEESHYLHDPAALIVLDGVPEAIAAVNRRGVPVVVVTNQAGIGRGLYDVHAYRRVNEAIAAIFAAAGARVDAWYFCPHRPDEGCLCRKPRPGMLRTAAADLDLDLAASVLVGDKVSDLEAARAVGARTVLVRTGYGRKVEAELATALPRLADAVFDALPAAVPSLLATLGAGERAAC